MHPPPPPPEPSPPPWDGLYRAKLIIPALKLLGICLIPLGLLIWIFTGLQAETDPAALLKIAIGATFVVSYAICRSKLSWRWKIIPFLLCLLLPLISAYLIWQMFQATPRPLSPRDLQPHASPR